MSDDEARVSSIAMDAFARWEDAHPVGPVQGEFVLDVRIDLLRCDECGAQADMFHFVNSRGGAPGVGDVRGTKVMFSCPDHSFEGYEVDFPRLLAGLGEGRSFLTHIAEKTWGLFAVAELRKRLGEIHHASQIAEGYRVFDP